MLEVGNKGITIRRLKSLGVGALVWRWREFMGQDRAQNDLFPALCAKYGIEIGSAANAWLLLVLEGKMRTVWITVCMSRSLSGTTDKQSILFTAHIECRRDKIVEAKFLYYVCDI